MSTHTGQAAHDRIHAYPAVARALGLLRRAS